VVRDWSEEGEAERSSCYKPVTDTIVRLFPSDQWSVSEGLVIAYVICNGLSRGSMLK